MLFLVEFIHRGSMGGHPRTRMCDTGKKPGVNQDRSGESRAYFIDILDPASLCLCGRCEERRLGMQGSGPDFDPWSLGDSVGWRQYWSFCTKQGTSTESANDRWCGKLQIWRLEEFQKAEGGKVGRLKKDYP